MLNLKDKQSLITNITTFINHVFQGHARGSEDFRKMLATNA